MKRMASVLPPLKWVFPSEFLLPYAKKGIIEGKSALVEEGGDNSQYFNGLHEGGARNGVLTAIEDFLKDFGNVFDAESNLLIIY